MILIVIVIKVIVLYVLMYNIINTNNNESLIPAVNMMLERLSREI